MVMLVITQFHRSQICHPRLNCRQRFGGWERPQMGCNEKSAKYDSTGKYLPVKKPPIIFANFEVSCGRVKINLGGR